MIREARGEDLDGLLSLYGELALDDGALPGDAAGSGRALEAILAEPGHHLLVAERAGELLGTVDVVIAANLTHGARPWALIENVVVAARARRGGVGRELMGSAFELARAAGCYKAMLLSNKRRDEAHAFYRELGMSATSEGFKIYFDGSTP
jgi:GNAT superfamily N-acetyltransferase